MEISALNEAYFIAKNLNNKKNNTYNTVNQSKNEEIEKKEDLNNNSVKLDEKFSNYLNNSLKRN